MFINSQFNEQKIILDGKGGISSPMNLINQVDNSFSPATVNNLIKTGNIEEAIKLLEDEGLSYTHEKQTYRTTTGRTMNKITITYEYKGIEYTVNNISEANTADKPEESKPNEYTEAELAGLDKSAITAYFTQQENGKFVMNQTAIAADFPEEEYGKIDTPAKLKEAIAKSSRTDNTSSVAGAGGTGGAGSSTESKPSMDNLKSIENTLQDELDDISLKLSSLDVPTPPNRNDYILSNSGLVDEDAFNKALDDYKNELEEFNYKRNMLNQLSNEIVKNLQKINKQITELEFGTKIENIESIIKELSQNPNTDGTILSEFKAALEKIKQEMENLPSQKLELQNKLQDIYYNISSLNIPNPPSTNDYLKPDGSLDEEAYEKAYNDYEQKISQYDQTVSKLEMEAGEIRNEISAIDMRIQNNSANLNRIDININAKKMLQDSINGTDDKELMKELNKILEDLYKNINAQNEVNKKAEALFESQINASIPIPPNANEYLNSDGSVDEDSYAQAYKKYEEDVKEFDTKMQQYNTLSLQVSVQANNLNDKIRDAVFQANFAVAQNKVAQLKEAGNNDEANSLENKLNNLNSEYNSTRIKKQALSLRQVALRSRLNSLKTPTPPNTNDYLKSDGTVDEKAYETAFNKYEQQVNKYDMLSTTLNEELEIITDKLKSLEEKMAEIQKSVSELV